METIDAIAIFAGRHPIEILILVVVLAVLLTFALGRQTTKPAYLPLRKAHQGWGSSKPLHRGYQAAQRNFGNPGVGVSWSEPPSAPKGQVAEHVYRSGETNPLA